MMIGPSSFFASDLSPNDDLKSQWEAKWITAPGILGNEFGVYLFQRSFEIEDTPPDAFIVKVSADNRFKLYLNGHYIGNGPSRGHALKWRYQSIDLAPHLREGTNLLAAVVWNFAEERPAAQVTVRTGFILEGMGEAASLSTDDQWFVCPDPSLSPLHADLRAYFAVGPGERVDARHRPWDWNTQPLPGANWLPARELDLGIPVHAAGAYGHIPKPLLAPRTIPPMERTPQRFSAVRRGDLPGDPEAFLLGEQPLRIPAHASLRFLLDQGQLTTAYPVLSTDGGKGTLIRLSYAESLFHDHPNKGNRDEVEGKQFIGFSDEFILDGKKRTFETFWWRTFRYVQVEIETAAESCTLRNLSSIFTAYPLIESASFNSPDNLHAEIWKVGWHTQRLCAGETFFDCPYYEQLQYVGDTRIQSLVTSYVSGDPRLIRRALLDFAESRQSFGLTQSRFPSASEQIIPPFSLYWIDLVHDYWMLHGEPELIEGLLPAIAEVLRWFEDRIAADGLPGPMEWWNFVDWVEHPGWEFGNPPGNRGAGSTIIACEYVYALQYAADLFESFGRPGAAADYRTQAESVRTAVRLHCWDAERGLFADTPALEHFSQHANLMAVLAEVAPTRDGGLMERVLGDPDLAPCSYYYRFYLAEALRKAGLADRYTELLGPWQAMLDQGLSTFAESLEPSRSDCHAWSSSPLYHFLSLVGGIRPGSPGFSTVTIAPALGELSWIDLTMPHPEGEIRLRLEQKNGTALIGEVFLPGTVTGSFSCGETRFDLVPGMNRIEASRVP